MHVRGEPPLIIECVVGVAEVKFLRYPAQGLGVSEEEKPAGGERPRDAGDDEPDRVRREVYGDVPAEDDVERLRLPEGRIAVEEVPLLEHHGPPDGVVERETTSVGPEVPRLHLRRRLAQGPRRVVSASRPGERRAVEVDADDLDLPASQLHGVFSQQDRQRIRLFTRGASRREDAEPACVTARSQPLGQRGLGECLEVIRVSEEVRLPHGDLCRDGGQLLGPSPGAREPVEIFRAVPSTPLLAALLEHVGEEFELPVLELETELPADDSPETVHVGR